MYRYYEKQIYFHIAQITLTRIIFYYFLLIVGNSVKILMDFWRQIWEILKVSFWNWETLIEKKTLVDFFLALYWAGFLRVKNKLLILCEICKSVIFVCYFGSALHNLLIRGLLRAPEGDPKGDPKIKHFAKRKF